MGGFGENATQAHRGERSKARGEFGVERTELLQRDPPPSQPQAVAAALVEPSGVMDGSLMRPTSKWWREDRYSESRSPGKAGAWRCRRVRMENRAAQHSHHNNANKVRVGCIRGRAARCGGG